MNGALPQTSSSKRSTSRRASARPAFCAKPTFALRQAKFTRCWAATGPGNRPSSESCPVRSAATPASFPSQAVEDYDASEIAVVFQELALLPDLSVAENIHLPHRRDAFGRIDDREMEALAAEALAMIDPALVRSLRRPVSSLDLHQRQLVEIARALSSGAKLILLDEPTANLTFADAERLFAILRRLTKPGSAFFWSRTE